MATEVWWVDPPKNIGAGGYLTYKEHDLEVDLVDVANQFYYVGFKCIKQNWFPADLISDRYECWSHHAFLRFNVPTTASGTVINADMYLVMLNHDYLLSSNPDNMYMDVWYRNLLDPQEFPWSTLTDEDYPSGAWAKGTTYSGSFQQMYYDYVVTNDGNIYWVGPIDVTDAVQHAISEGWDRLGILLTPNPATPTDWDYDDRPTNYDQKCRIQFYGAAIVNTTSSPDGFPTATSTACPWLEITYSGGVGAPPPPQYEPGEDVTTSGQGAEITCVAADINSNTGLIGASTGSLWCCWSGGVDGWSKIYEFGEPISSIYMDYVHNFLNYPNSQVTWIGTASGTLYKSTNSLQTWNVVKDDFGGTIVEIMGSQLNSNNVAVGISTGIWVTMDGGETWVESLHSPIVEL